MKTYSRIFHHITTEDVKRKQRESIDVQKNKDKREIYLEEEKLYVASVMKEQKFDWRKDLNDK